MVEPPVQAIVQRKGRLLSSHTWLGAGAVERAAALNESSHQCACGVLEINASAALDRLFQTRDGLLMAAPAEACHSHSSLLPVTPHQIL